MNPQQTISQIDLIIKKVEWHASISRARNFLTTLALGWLFAARYLTPPVYDYEVIVALVFLAFTVGLAIYGQIYQPK